MVLSLLKVVLFNNNGCSYRARVSFSFLRAEKLHNFKFLMAHCTN